MARLELTAADILGNPAAQQRAQAWRRQPAPKMIARHITPPKAKKNPLYRRCLYRDPIGPRLPMNPLHPYVIQTYGVILPVTISPTMTGRQIMFTYGGAIASFFGVTTDQILTRNRKGHVALARQVLFYALHKRRWAYDKIALVCGRLDHTTVLHGVRKVSQLIEADLLPDPVAYLHPERDT